MTNTAELRQRTRAATDNLAQISGNLTAALEDVALLERLKSAPDRAARLTAEKEKATKERDRALAAEAKAAKAARFAGITDIRVAESPETASKNENVVRSSWTITWTAPTWDGYASRPKEHSRASFGSLPHDVLAYLVEERPDLIPAKIMALCPGSPLAAFNRYFVSCKRGFVA
jgi:hypothetical protein